MKARRSCRYFIWAIAFGLLVAQGYAATSSSIAPSETGPTTAPSTAPGPGPNVEKLSSQFSGSTIDSPSYKVGDKWTWEHLPDGAKRSLQVMEVKGDMTVTLGKTAGSEPFCLATPPVVEMLAERDKNGTIIKITDLSGKVISGCSYLTEKQWKWLDFPLSVGKKWSFTVNMVTTHNGLRPQHLDPFSNDFAVESSENVTVPAGTFMAFKIKQFQTMLSCGINPSWRRGAGATKYLWYAPDVKQIVKQSDWGGGGVSNQLISYSLQ